MSCPVTDTGLLSLNEPTWTGIAAIASALAAIATGFLAFVTWRLADETRRLVRSDTKDRQQAQRHHEQSLEPHIALFVDRDSITGEEWVMLKNIGPGYAKDIQMTGEIGQRQDIAIWNVPPALGADQACKYIQMLPGANHGVIWRDFSLKYKDAFDNEFETRTAEGDDWHTFIGPAGYIFRRLSAVAAQHG